ncbi:single-stranded DNA-binding protein, partial [Intestinibacter sp.]|uniref:single-stranded DNA-binding protein n=1 Tax=Intestinibacter sp. TaxID=1965304 RepID=UPI003F18A5DF
SKFTVAIDRTYKKEGASVTDFIPIEIWGKKAEYCATYLGKGYLVAINGNLHIDKFIDSTGNSRNFAKVVASSVVKLNTPKSAQDTANTTATDAANATATCDTTPSENLTECTNDDDLPFTTNSTTNAAKSPQPTESPPNKISFKKFIFNKINLLKSKLKALISTFKTKQIK